MSRESLRLALIASFQYLPPRQRAVLLLRDVLAFPAADLADMLGMTTTAVKSALQRARGRLEEVAPAADQVAEPSEPGARALLDQYIQAFETADAATLKQLLRRDATLELPPSAAWFTGGRAIAEAVKGLGSRATGGCWPWRPTGSRRPRLTTASQMAATAPTGSSCSPPRSPASRGMALAGNRG